MATTGQGVLRRLLVVFEFGVDTSKVDAGKKKLDSLFKDMQKVAMAFAGGAIAKGIGNFVKDTVDEMMQIRRGAAELRITTHEMQGLQLVAKATGSDAKWLAWSMERLQVNVERAARGGRNQSESMRLLGLTTKDANGKTKSATELYLETADALSKMTDQNKQAIVVRDLFGIGGHRQLPILRMGRKAIEELMQITEEYGEYTDKAIEESAKYTVTLLKLEAVFRGIKSFIMTQWLPMLGKQTEWLVRAGKWLHTMMKNSLLAKASLQLLQAVMAGLIVKMMAAYPYATALIGALGVLALTLDALEVWWQGGESIITSILDGVFGKGASTAVLREAHDLWKGIKESIQAIQKAMGIDKPTTTDVGPKGGGAAAPTLGDKGSVKASYSPLGMLLNALSPGAQVAHQYVETNGGVEVRRGFWERFLDPEGKRIAFQPPRVVDTQTRPNDAPNMSIGDVHFDISMPEGTDSMSLGKETGRAFTEQLDAWWSEKTQAAAASTRREKQASGE